MKYSKHFVISEAKVRNSISLKGRGEFLIEVLNSLLDCLIIQLKKIESYKYVGEKILKFLAGWP